MQLTQSSQIESYHDEDANNLHFQNDGNNIKFSHIRLNSDKKNSNKSPQTQFSSFTFPDATTRPLTLWVYSRWCGPRRLPRRRQCSCGSTGHPCAATPSSSPPGSSTRARRSSREGAFQKFRSLKDRSYFFIKDGVLCIFSCSTFLHCLELLIIQVLSVVINHHVQQPFCLHLYFQGSQRDPMSYC